MVRPTTLMPMRTLEITRLAEARPVQPLAKRVRQACKFAFIRRSKLQGLIGPCEFHGLRGRSTRLAPGSGGALRPHPHD